MTDKKRLEIIRREKCISIIQQDDEILWALDECRKYLGDKKVKRFLEIGCFTGGSLCMWEQLLANDGELYGISPDNNPSKLIETVKLFTGKNIHFINGRSEDNETMVTLRQMLGNNKLDGIFVDSVHTAEQSAMEFGLYKPLLNSPAVMIFHDIVCRFRVVSHFPLGQQIGGKPNTGDFWTEIKYDYNYLEKHCKNGGGNFGIGILLL